MKSFNELKHLLKFDRAGMMPIKVAVLGDTATQLLAQAIEAMGVQSGFDISIFEAGYNMVEQQIIDPNSELYKFNAEFVIIFQSTHKLLERFANTNPQDRIKMADDRVQFVENICTSPLLEGKKIIYVNYPEIDDNVFGNYANKTKESFIYQVRKLNFLLMNKAEMYSDLFIVDLAALQNQFGRQWLFTPNIYISTDMVISIDALPCLASRILNVISAIKGMIHKCLILDLDNTLWGGVIGDNGIEGIQLGHGLGIGKAFTEFQMWVKKLQQRGIIICVVSKNDETTAKQPFANHPDMVLKLDDIAVFVANWNNKVDNIRYIQKILKIGFDSMVFIDDNPFERNIVRENIEGITVPELPDDPAEYLEFLYSLNLFETASASYADNQRTRQYQEEAKRGALQKTFKSEEDFLKSLNMVAGVSGFTAFNTPRVAQLSQRSNQFNLRTVRYTDCEVEALAADKSVIDLAFTLKDRFGDNGLIAVVIMKPLDKTTLFIDTWLMSCRVLKRGMEDFTLNVMVERARKAGYKRLIGEYLPTPKNKLVENHYPSLGFKHIEQSETARFSLDLNDYNDRKCNITLQNTN